jgi:hypothetical protein
MLVPLVLPMTAMWPTVAPLPGPVTGLVSADWYTVASREKVPAAVIFTNGVPLVHEG